MKKISVGRCPHVVNMIGCCTLQEPLALVLEYAAFGDLLAYLRTIRKRVRLHVHTYTGRLSQSLLWLFGMLLILHLLKCTYECICPTCYMYTCTYVYIYLYVYVCTYIRD